MAQNFANNLDGIVDKVSNYISRIAGVQTQVSQIALDSAFSQALNALDIASAEAVGLEALQVINQIATEQNVVSDAELLATRQAFMLAGKAMESAMLVAQFREKTLGMFITITEQRTNNVWGRIKQLSGGFKF